jgi:hypothetical protein
MDVHKSVYRRALLALAAVLIVPCLASCDWILGLEEIKLNICQRIDGAPFQTPTSAAPPAKVFEDPGIIVAFHGSGTAESKKSGQQDLIKIQQSVNLPSYVTNATVFLNGWRVQYLSGDHHVAGLGTIIRKIAIVRGKLNWEAIGVLSDNNFDDPYNWSYAYTVLAWNEANINLAVTHTDGSCDPRDHRGNYFIADNTWNTTALSAFASFIRNVDFSSFKTVAVLPRGFGFLWSDGDDHHLLQLGYNLDHSESFIEKGKKYKKRFEEEVPMPDSPSRVGSEFVSWATYAIFKDNDRRRDYTFGEVVSGLSGDDVGIIQPPFSILPREGIGFSGACLAEPGNMQTQEFVVERIPYRYAIPMLTGWELAYSCTGDQHVTEAGIWIDEIQYDPNSPGTLRYKLTSVLHDEDNSPTFAANHKVTILGVRAATLRTPVTGAQPMQRRR